MRIEYLTPNAKDRYTHFGPLGPGRGSTHVPEVGDTVELAGERYVVVSRTWEVRNDRVRVYLKDAEPNTTTV